MSKRERVHARFDADAAAARVDRAGARAQAQEPGDAAHAMKLVGKATATGYREMDDFERAALHVGAPLPSDFRLMKSSARIVRAATPPGYDSAPAWVVQFEGNSPIARLSRARPGEAPALDGVHVGAASKLVRLHARAVKPPAVTASYDGPRAVSVGKTCWIDVACDDWAQMQEGLRVLLPVERFVVLEAVVHDTPIATLAARGVVQVTKRMRAEAAIVQTLRLGLERLALTWGLDAGGPRKA